MSNNLERARSVVYELFSQPFGNKQIQEPKGYRNDQRGYERDKDSRGFVIKSEIDLEFYGDGSEYLERIFLAYGVNERCLLTKYERDQYSISEELKLRYTQEIDFTTYKKDSKTGKVTVNIKQGGLYDLVKNRASDEYDLINNISADGVDIGEITTKPFSAIPRSLFLQSLLREKNRKDYVLNTKPLSSDGTITRASRTIPLRIIYQSGTSIQTPYNTNVSNDSNSIYAPESIDINDVESVGNLVYWRSRDVTRTINYKLKIKYSIASVYSRNVDYLTTNRLLGEPFTFPFGVYRKVASQDEQNPVNDLVKEIDLIQSFVLTPEDIGIEKTIDTIGSVELLEGESLGFCFQTFATVDTGVFETDTGNVRIKIDISESELVIDDDASYPQTVSRCMKPLDFFNRIMAKITGKQNVVTSDLFTVGEYKDIVVDNGLWARGFPDKFLNASNEEEFIQMKTSFKDAFESFNYLEPLCWFTYFEGSEEKIRIEKATYTQQNFVGIDLGAVDDIENEVSGVDYFSTIELGHGGSLEYEELYGRDEPNGKTEFSTFINKNVSKYSVISKIRTDATGYELIRRVSYLNYPKEDTPRDNELWMHDAKLLDNGTYTHNLYTDLGFALPIGVYRPQDLWNFRLSPINRLYYGHGYSVKRGLFHFPNKEIRFSSSNSNQNLVTELNGVVLSESGSLQIKDLPKPRIEAELINFTFKLDQRIEETLLSFKNVNGDLIPNYFGLIRYKEKGEDKYGRLVKLEADEEAKITLIKVRL